MEDKKQFDELLGGSETLPGDAHVLKLAAARANEIAAMTYSLENPQSNKLIFQKLPIHMRRRVMSHNAKRMPRKLRNSHLQQMMKSGLPPKTKRPSRKYRRRPQNLLSAYNRRKIKKYWLETHIWHAKRFKMIEKWGHRLGNHSNDRCFKASYRAIANHCLIQDISYYICIQIIGPFDDLKEELKTHCNPNELTFGAKIFIKGQREGSLMFYKKNQYPFGAIGYVKFLWEPGDEKSKAIWLWIHPAIINEILEELIHTFEFQRDIEPTVDNRSFFDPVTQRIKEEFSLITDIHWILQNFEVPKYSNATGCSMVILKNCLNRFSLTGPLSLSIISDTFKVPSLENIQKSIISLPESEESTNKAKYSNWSLCTEILMENDCVEPAMALDAWFKNYCIYKDNITILNKQNDIFNRLRFLKSPSQLPPGLVLGLTVLDPRFYLPHKRKKTTSKTPESECVISIPPLVNFSAIWNPLIRAYVTDNAVSTTSINDLRSKNAVPGVHNDYLYNEDIMQKIPVLLIQKPGKSTNNNRIGFGSGIDIILPSQWGMAIWLGLILRCARPGGLREAKNIAFESCNTNLSWITNPDTKSYKDESCSQKYKLREIYFKRPPNKRVNYIKYGISSPFFCEWKILMEEWGGKDNFYVLRNRRGLQLLNKLVNSKDVQNQNQNVEMEIHSVIGDTNCLIPVRVTVLNKGVPKDFSIICLPSEEDIKLFNSEKNWSGPVQTLISDVNESKRSQLRKDHKKLLKRLHKRKIRAKKKVDIASSQIPVRTLSEVKHLKKMHYLIQNKLKKSNLKLIQSHAKKMSDLYLPQCTQVRCSCDREVIGYVVNGGYSYSEAKGIGLGYVVYPSLWRLKNSTSNLVLIRNPTTKQFRISSIEILSE